MQWRVSGRTWRRITGSLTESVLIILTLYAYSQAQAIGKTPRGRTVRPLQGAGMPFTLKGNRPTPPGGVAHSSGTNWTGRSGWVIIGIGLRRDNNSSIAWFFRCASIELLGGIGQPAGFCGVPRGAELSGRSFAM